jgi:hypothetical protein
MLLEPKNQQKVHVYIFLSILLFLNKCTTDIIDVLRDKPQC